jgi:anoctamin-10
MFSNDGIGPNGSPHEIKAWGLLLAVFLSEQAFLAVRWAVAKTISKLKSPAMVQDRRKKYLLRQKYVDQSFKMVSGKKSSAAAVGLGLDAVHKGEKESLEAHARDLAASSTEDAFWLRQKDWKEAAKIGEGLISRMSADIESKKEK